VVVTWTTPLPTATYTITTTMGGETTSGLLRVQLPGALPRQSPFEQPRAFASSSSSIPRTTWR